jgi:hypothetical protein
VSISLRSQKQIAHAHARCWGGGVRRRWGGGVRLTPLLAAGGIREMHWHQAAEWGSVLDPKGRAYTLLLLALS